LCFAQRKPRFRLPVRHRPEGGEEPIAFHFS
jgi:hypothetical protein